MTILTIDCPTCGAKVEVTEDALTGRIRQNVLNELLPDIESQKRELEKGKRELLTMQKAVQEAIDKGVDAGIEHARIEALSQARSEIAKEQMETQATIESQKSALEEKNNIELELRRERKDLQRQLDEQEVLRQRSVDAEVATARNEIEQKAKLKENEFAVRELSYKRKVEELQKQLEQRSNQTQGDALEIDLAQKLQAMFPDDFINRIGKGERGADCMHRVISASGVEIGAILWESKNTKTFSEAWIQKLKDDVLAAKADFGFIFSMAMPKEFSTFGVFNGIWVTSSSCLEGFARLMRSSLIRVAAERNIQAGKQSKAEMLYEYMT
ncbi:MAG: DUF2130 domain-containing protein, partial [Rhabdochlamydiaceae bacterium]